ncbi:alpha/beta hydrolase [Corallococcus sp. AB030]|uniref:Alpha/beta hydrolase n=2 Tax=Corallococcus exiguus TaxID=83462 RepID=A0A7X4YJ12_9BACT|nr:MULTISPECIES: alpha/beta hydrolase [Corallococcus]NBC46151.1 alpha/beta hydrolase [Corallococcus exiguus]NPD23924.1 alpha/beta hydrolase [Corallococcus exiguus]RKI02223.1 alpha/beta hydrolase [Corallococcus sp. AB030]TNV54768.1 alpha/beta hydrolase [Corallococcus exiguus]
MVQKGQFLERSTLIPVGSSGAVMEGTVHRGQKSPPLLILPPRPEEGGGMDHVLAAELAFAVARAGFPTLRFNHRGVGASQGVRGTGGALVEDAEAAMRVTLENAGTTALAVASLYGGARVALALQERHPAVGGLCLVAPDVDPLSLVRLSCPLLVIVGAEDTRVPRAALAAAVAEAGGDLEVIDDAGATFHRNLPQVGRAAAAWLQRLSGG